MPVYNSGKYLKTAVGSILNQSLKDIELILVDDGSTDGSSERCDEYAQQDNRIVVIHQKNGGICNARNAALKIARGEYIGFSDHDDEYLPGFLEHAYTEAKKNNADLTIICTNERKKQIRKAKPKKCIVIYNTPKISENILNSKIIKSSTDKFKIVYVGILQECRLLKEIGEEIKKYPEIELHIGGFGKLETYFFELSKEFNNIFYYGQMKYEDVLKLEKDSDILFATYNPKVANHKFSAPNKLYESMALGKPIIVCKGTGIDKIVEEENIGYSISYDSKEFIKFAYKIKENINIKNILEANAKNIYNKKYSWDKMSKKLLEEYKILGEK